MTLDQTSEEVFSTVTASALAFFIGRERLAFTHFVQRNFRHQGVAGVDERHEFPEGVLAKQVVELGDLAHEAVVALRVVNRLDGTLDVDAGFQKSERTTEGHLAQDVEGEEVQPSTEVEDLAATTLVEAPAVVVPTARAELGDLAHEHLDSVVDEGAELPHRGHAVGDVGHLLLLCVHLLADLREDVGVLWRREDGVEVRLVETLPGREDVTRCCGAGDRDLVGCDPHDGAVVSVEVDKLIISPSPRRRYELPKATT